ncbi:putative peptidase (plasmid) [Rhodococcus sp. WAY2]|nr:putative peptidase [Rhodococcus sp. WAY2]
MGADSARRRTITTYGYNSDNLVEVGQRVNAGQRFATIGNRGSSSGPDLHFEVEAPDGDKTDPLKLLTKRRRSSGSTDGRLTAPSRHEARAALLRHPFTVARGFLLHGSDDGLTASGRVAAGRQGEGRP